MITKPLEDLKRKDVLWWWRVVEQVVFEALKTAFVQASVLMMLNMDAAFWVETDVYNFAMGTVLSQKVHDREWRPVAFFFKLMQPAECNYNVHNKELLLVVRAFEAWQPYLEGSPFPINIFSDHCNLECFMTANTL